jgi:hypothetical protein
VSAFGPALFVRRLDKKELDDEEQERILELVCRAAEALRVKDDEDEPVEPNRYDCSEMESGALGVLLYSSYVYRQMPDEIRADQDENWAELGQTIGREIERAVPNTYSFDCYAVEN